MCICDDMPLTVAPRDIGRKKLEYNKSRQKKTYSQNWLAYDKAQSNEKALFIQFMRDLCANIAEKPYTFGRPRMSMRDMVFSSALKVFSTFSLRRFENDMKDAEAKGMITRSPDYSTIAKYMESEDMTPILRELITITSLPLRKVEEKSFSIDSSGISQSKYVRWFDHKWGKKRDRRLWYKVHILTGNRTHVVCGVEVTSQFVSDSIMLPQLFDKARTNFDIGILAADKGYLSEKNLVYVDEHNAVPIIPFKKNTRIPESWTVWGKMYNFFTLRTDDFLRIYHKRSNVETTFHMIKAKFGSYVRSKTETACINEILLKVLCHNICVIIQAMFEMGIEPKFILSE